MLAGKGVGLDADESPLFSGKLQKGFRHIHRRGPLLLRPMDIGGRIDDRISAADVHLQAVGHLLERRSGCDLMQFMCFLQNPVVLLTVSF